MQNKRLLICPLAQTFFLFDAQELQLALQKVRSALQEKDEQLRESEHERLREKEERERTAGELRTFLQIKEQLVEVRCSQDIFPGTRKYISSIKKR